MKVLIVDDSLVFQNFFKSTLTELSEVSYIYCVSNGRQALQQIKLTEFDLIILDLEMPVMDGTETLKEIKKNRFKGKIIVCSGLVSVDYKKIQEILSLGADGVMSKTYQRGVSDKLSPEVFREQLIPRLLNIYNSKFVENRFDIVKHSYDKECIDGVLIIHLLKKNEEMMTYKTGELLDGVKQVVRVIEECVKTKTPVFLDESVDSHESFDEINDAIKNLPPELLYDLKEISSSDLALDWVHPEMRTFIEENHIANLLVLGFNRTCCVKNASKQINNTYHSNIIICDDLLFGHKNIEIRGDSEVVKTKKEFEENYIIQESLHDVIKGLWKNEPVKKKRKLIA